MPKWFRLDGVCIAFFALTACAPFEGDQLTQCEMTVETLAVKEAGPLELLVFGSKTLCIEREGDRNLTPFLATARITNMSKAPVIVRYSFEPLRSFQSKRIAPGGRLSESIDFLIPPAILPEGGSGGPLERTLQLNDTLLISSWSRHHRIIWNEVSDQMAETTDGKPYDYTVGFDLSLTYDNGAGQIGVSETFDIPLRGVPVLRGE